MNSFWKHIIHISHSQKKIPGFANKEMKQHLRLSGDRKELVFYLLWNHLFLPSGIIGWIKVDRVWVRNCGMICLAVPGTEVSCLLIGPQPSVLGSDWLRAPDLAAPGIQGPRLLVSSCHLWTVSSLLAGTSAWTRGGAITSQPFMTKLEKLYKLEIH